MNTEELGIGIIYLKNCFDESELDEIAEYLDSNGLILRTEEKIPFMVNASIDFLYPIVEIFLSPKLESLWIGLATNALYDVIKTLLVRIRRKITSQPTFKIQGGIISKTPPSIHFIIGNIHYVLPLDVDDETFKSSIDKYFDVTASSMPNGPMYAFYSDENDTIVIKTEDDIIKEEIRKHLENRDE